MKKIYIRRSWFIGWLLVMGSLQTKGQVMNFGTGYFQNQYLFNPAMSGLDAGKGNIGAGYRKSGTVKDGPQSAYVTGDYAFSNTMGAGILVNYDKAGLFNSTKVMATYAYHIQLSETQRLHFGLSAGGTHQRLNSKALIADLDDPSIYNFNNQPMQFEADFGVAYTDKQLTIQAAAPNLVSTFRKDTKDVVNRNILMAAIAYRFRLGTEEDNWSITPKAIFRGIKGNTSIVEGGANISYRDVINVFGLYHSNKSITAGAGVKLGDIAGLSVLYTTQPSEFRAYSGGDFEIGLLFHL